MPKYKVFKRVPHSAKNENNELIHGEMVEFVQIPDEGPAQVQVYFVPQGVEDAAILGVASKHHEDELKEKNIGFAGPQSPLNDAVTELEPTMEVVVSKSGLVSAKVVKAEKE